jgi:hypothetical protein
MHNRLRNEMSHELVLREGAPCYATNAGTELLETLCWALADVNPIDKIWGKMTRKRRWFEWFAKRYAIARQNIDTLVRGFRHRHEMVADGESISGLLSTPRTCSTHFQGIHS